MPRYQQDSIIEALCEFSFEPTTPAWDPTVFGGFLHAFGEGEFPHREAGEVVSLGLMASGGEVFPKAEHQQRMRFFNEGRTRLAQVGAHSVAANVLKPYPHWDEFKPFILRTLAAYRKAAPRSDIARMALRYIDQIQLPPGPVILGDWLVAGSDFVPGFLRDAGLGAFSRVSKRTGATMESITVALDSSPMAALMLDTELVVLAPEGSEQEIGRRLDELHSRINEIFEQSVSDQTRSFLQPVSV